MNVATGIIRNPKATGNSPIIWARGNVIIWLSELTFRGRKPLKNKGLRRSDSYSHSIVATGLGERS